MVFSLPDKLWILFNFSPFLKKDCTCVLVCFLPELEPLILQESKYQNNTITFYGTKEESNGGAKAVYTSIRNKLAFSRRKFKQIIPRESSVLNAAKNKI